jgi:hydroxypyruvate reductase
VIAAGKAAAPMAAAAGVLLGSRLAGGLIASPHHVDVSGGLFAAVHAGHPVPNAGSEAAGRRALALASEMTPDEVLVVLLSGGASAALAAPASGVTLDDKRRTTEVLLKAGADIHAMNVVRKHLSALKGGQLAAAASVTHTLAISDVVGDDLSVIGSGPTVPDASTFDDALSVLRGYGGLGAYPDGSVRRLLHGAAGGVAETPKPGDPRLARSFAQVIGSRHDAMRGAAEKARRLGYHTIVVEAPVVGEARIAARAYAAEVRRWIVTVSRPACIVSSGETTVRVVGGGRGGRNQEFALAVAEELGPALRTPLRLACAGTDGVDGPTDAAGAMVDHTTLTRAAKAGVRPRDALDRNDSHTFFAELGDLIHTGPTGTNVGDLQVLLLTV